jgi:hypothetical protein
MEGLSQVISHPVTARVDGEDVQLDGIGLGDFAAVETELLARRPNLITLAVEASEGQPDNVKEFLLHEAMVESRKGFKVTEEELWSFIMSTEGLVFILHQSLERRYAGRFSRDRLFRWVLRAPKEAGEAMNRLMIASGLDSRGNSGNGQRPTTGATTNPAAGQTGSATSATSEPTGNISFGNSVQPPSTAAPVSRRRKSLA